MGRWRAVVVVVGMSGAALWVACTGDDPKLKPGENGGECSPAIACIAGLECVNSTCRPGDGGASSGSSGTSGTSGTSGSSGASGTSGTPGDGGLGGVGDCGVVPAAGAGVRCLGNIAMCNPTEVCCTEKPAECKPGGTTCTGFAQTTHTCDSKKHCPNGDLCCAIAMVDAAATQSCPVKADSFSGTNCQQACIGLQGNEVCTSDDGCRQGTCTPVEMPFPGNPGKTLVIGICLD